MARRALLMGNWKMYKTVAEARAFAEALGRQAGALLPTADYAVCAPFTTLHVLRVMLPAQVKMGAQNVHFATEGAFTGEISAPMLTEFGTTYVIVGHSERRNIFAESDEWIAKKVRTVVNHQMVPVLCVGEDLEQKERGETVKVVEGQVESGLSTLLAAEVANSVIAYEPIWAIGSGKTATPGDAEEVAGQIRATVERRFGKAAAESVRILYGGSVKPENIASFTEQPNIDGALVGGASLAADSFAAMAKAMGGQTA